jgi:leucine dehydrogenase
MTVFSDSAYDNHERVLFCRDIDTGLYAIIAIHSTALGPSAGGTRLWNYDGEAEALHDVLRLSQGMSYKNAMAGLKLGGGKAVILDNPEFIGDDAAFEKFGEFVDSLGGAYITAEDVGMTVGIMETVARKTRYVTGLPSRDGKAGGDPSPKTAFGILQGIRAAARVRLERSDLEGLSVAIQGVGKVGLSLCGYLRDAGASLIVADIDAERVSRACDEYGARPATTDSVLFEAVDVVSPCALGAILTRDSIPRIQATIVAGAANNQLEVAEDGERLAARNILYAPDYVINAGGIINVSCEYEGNVDDETVMQLVAQIGPRLDRVFEEAARTGEPTNVIADRRAREIIANA